LKARLALLAGLSPVLCATPAAAEEPFQTAGGGVFLGYAFGERGGFEWGIEGFATRYFGEHTECESSSIERRGFGPVLRLRAVKLSQFEITVAGHIGTDLPNLRAIATVDGELGLSVLFEPERGIRLGPRYGGILESIFVNMYLRQAWLFEDEQALSTVSFGGGARLWPTLGPSGFCSEGRPYRGGCGEEQPAHVSETAGFDTRDPRAARWVRRAREECASVPAFLQLAQELLELEAPLELVARAVHAADEELGHTRAALQLAEYFGGSKVLVSPPAFRERRSLPRTLALRRLANESWHDGCLNEGRAAATMALEAEHSDDPQEARVLRRVAREETTHAALALDVLRWAIACDPTAARDLSLPRALAVG
jgi:hypothetical protein